MELDSLLCEIVWPLFPRLKMIVEGEFRNGNIATIHSERDVREKWLEAQDVITSKVKVMGIKSMQ